MPYEISKNKILVKLKFQVKGLTDAVVLFSACDGCDGYEIVIGGWTNTQSVIRQSKQSINKIIQNTPDILSATEYREFWISLKLDDQVH